MTSHSARSEKKQLDALFDAAVAAAHPKLCVPPHLPNPPAGGRTLVVGAGKAAAAMARAVEDHWKGPLSGLVVTRYGYGVPCFKIEVIEASHPVPDARGRAAAGRILELVRSAKPDDLVLCLISGGASALLALPARDISLEDKQATTRALLRSGATIQEINCVRKHLSAIKGGRLAAASPARIVTLAISDVVGDDPAVIGSGPTVPDPSTFAEARAIIAKYAIAAPPAVKAHLDAAADETPKPGDPRLARADYRIVATPAAALAAAAERARTLGIEPIVLGADLEGEARAVGAEHARMALERARDGARTKPCVILSGGELTVTIKGRGKGGPSTEYLLGMALALDGAKGIHALAADTDGIDGSEDNAGGMIGPDTLARARDFALDPAGCLAANDAFSFFRALGDLLVTGPTFTNVNDFRAILIV
ncbi:MAG: glycerate kinase [Rhodospirillaceae bacterium]|nr:glycerate kinase [Rhodospirillaceae bacterium]